MRGVGDVDMRYREGLSSHTRKTPSDGGTNHSPAVCTASVSRSLLKAMWASKPAGSPGLALESEEVLGQKAKAGLPSISPFVESKLRAGGRVTPAVAGARRHTSKKKNHAHPKATIPPR